MATRRIVASEKTILDQDDTVEEKSNISPAVPSDVIFKLIAFTLAMIIIPIGSYFVVKTVFNGNSTFAGGFAALMANVVLVGYIVVAFKEDQSDELDKKKPESKKDQ
ncbi:hypothetical protein B0T10DRAFT_477373 [Thelonectria olida]|uniref:Vacuolar ATPase assembly integral membrane protein VMA21 n=1 Tax=Thelonectria olida TaxID=1576542 RepID=A0A9P8WC97_9HYPO|nr:hypothetical protein B0T10DRAFT_477373 [Thelonectria olida]